MPYSITYDDGSVGSGNGTEGLTRTEFFLTEQDALHRASRLLEEA